MSEPASAPAGLGPDHGYGPDIDHVLLSEEQIQAKIGELAEQVARDYAGKEILLVGVLKGAVLFMSDFARALQLPTQMEFMAVSSYGSATSSSGIVRILKDLDRDITGKHVLESNLAAGAVGVAVLRGQVEQDDGNPAVHEMRGDLRAHDAGAEDRARRDAQAAPTV